MKRTFHKFAFEFVGATLPAIRMSSKAELWSLQSWKPGVRRTKLGIPRLVGHVPRNEMKTRTSCEVFKYRRSLYWILGIRGYRDCCLIGDGRSVNTSWACCAYSDQSQTPLDQRNVKNWGGSKLSRKRKRRKVRRNSGIRMVVVA